MINFLPSGLCDMFRGAEVSAVLSSLSPSHLEWSVWEVTVAQLYACVDVCMTCAILHFIEPWWWISCVPFPWPRSDWALVRKQLCSQWGMPSLACKHHSQYNHTNHTLSHLHRQWWIVSNSRKLPNYGSQPCSNFTVEKKKQSKQNQGRHRVWQVVIAV